MLSMLRPFDSMAVLCNLLRWTRSTNSALVRWTRSTNSALVRWTRSTNSALLRWTRSTNSALLRWTRSTNSALLRWTRSTNSALVWLLVALSPTFTCIADKTLRKPERVILQSINFIINNKNRDSILKNSPWTQTRLRPLSLYVCPADI